MTSGPCRIGFVTYYQAKDALKAKKALNDDPESKFHGLVMFSRQPTKNHVQNAPAFQPAVDHVEIRYHLWQSLRR
jgi:hypothetical protein